LVNEVLIQVSGEIDDEPGFLTSFDDHMKRLNAVGAGVIGREFDDGVEVHILAQSTADYVGIVKDGRGIRIFHCGWGGVEIEGDTMDDPITDEVEIDEGCIGFLFHGCDGVQPKSLFRITSDVSQGTQG
jgi:hypothetical protein